MKRFKGISMLLVGLIIGLAIATPIPSLGSSVIKLVVNGQQIQCDVPPQNINGRVLVPARYVAEALGATVTWDANTQTVIVSAQGNQNIEQTIINEVINPEPTVVNSAELMGIDSQMNDYFSYIDNVLKQDYITEQDIRTLAVKMNEAADVLIAWAELPQYYEIKALYVKTLTLGNKTCVAKQMMRSNNYDKAISTTAYFSYKKDYDFNRQFIQTEKERLQKLGY